MERIALTLLWRGAAAVTHPLCVVQPVQYTRGRDLPLADLTLCDGSRKGGTRTPHCCVNEVHAIPLCCSVHKPSQRPSVVTPAPSTSSCAHQCRGDHVHCAKRASRGNIELNTIIGTEQPPTQRDRTRNQDTSDHVCRCW